MAPRVDDSRLQVLLIDETPDDHDRMAALIEIQQEVELVGVADGAQDGIAKILSSAPHIVFLGLELGGVTGLDVIDAVGAEAMPTIVFVGADDKHAIEAFRFEPADYLLKPFSDERFVEALDRACRRARVRKLLQLRWHLFALLRHEDPDGHHRGRYDGTQYLERLAIPMRGRVEIVSLDEVDYIDANGVYCEIHAGEAEYMLRTSLSTLEALLDPGDFCRIHRSRIVRIDRIVALLRERGGEYRVQLRDGKELSVGRTRRAELESLLGRL